MEEEVARFLVQCGAAQQGVFELSSGRTADMYIDVKTVYKDGKKAQRLAAWLHDLLPDQVDWVAAEGYGGIPLGVTLRDQYNYRLCLVRGEEKQYGTERRVEHKPGEGATVAVVDDVWTTGQSAHSVKNALDSFNIDFAGFYTVVYRGGAPVPDAVSYLTDLEVINRYL